MQALVISPDSDARRDLLGALLRCGVDAFVCPRLIEARSHLKSESFRIVFCEDSLPDGDFRDVLRIVTHTNAKLPVVVCSRLGESPAYLEAMELGAFDYIAPPYRTGEVQFIINTALRQFSTLDSERLNAMTARAAG